MNFFRDLDTQGILQTPGRSCDIGECTFVFKFKNIGCRQRLWFDFKAKRPASRDLDLDLGLGLIASFLDRSN